mmetsp:Transcript_26392/g.57848  ORF Transcript_26392/g.57848 Transcript_26392/m.57848 type:complete len:184 (+) Transcript_26392:117-668(+)
MIWSQNLRHHLTPSTLAAVFLVLLFNAFFVGYANAQGTNKVYCGTEPCIAPLRSSCEDMIQTYKFQGSCCSLEKIPATGGCRVTVGFGNCFWYPFCGDCEVDSDIFTRDRCNNLFEREVEDRVCPDYDFNPLEIQKAPEWSPPSCTPSMAPTSFSIKADAAPIMTGGRSALLAVLLGVAVVAA